MCAVKIAGRAQQCCLSDSCVLQTVRLNSESRAYFVLSEDPEISKTYVGH